MRWDCLPRSTIAVPGVLLMGGIFASNFHDAHGFVLPVRGLRAAEDAGALADRRPSYVIPCESVLQTMMRLCGTSIVLRGIMTTARASVRWCGRLEGKWCSFRLYGRCTSRILTEFIPSGLQGYFSDFCMRIIIDQAPNVYKHRIASQRSCQSGREHCFLQLDLHYECTLGYLWVVVLSSDWPSRRQSATDGVM